MTKRRERRYPMRVTASVTADMANRIRAASERYAVAEAVIVRRAIENGLRHAIDAIRKQTPAGGEPPAE